MLSCPFSLRGVPMATLAGRITIYNMALGFIGTRTLASPNENTPEAIQCGLYWDVARRAALRDYPYRFALQRIQLGLLAKMPEVYDNQWKFAYSLPDSCLKVHSVYAERETDFKQNFQVESYEKGQLILTDLENAIALCTLDIDEISLWDDMFVTVMARKLACMIAIPLLKNNSQKLQELEQLYQAAVPRAQGHDASEQRQFQPLDSWLLARGEW